MNIYENIPDGIKNVRHIYQEYNDKDFDIKKMIIDKCRHDESFRGNLGEIGMEDLKYLEPEDLDTYRNFINNPEWTSDLDKDFLMYCRNLDSYVNSSKEIKKREIRRKFKESLKNYLFENNWRANRETRH